MQKSPMESLVTQFAFVPSSVVRLLGANPAISAEIDTSSLSLQLS